MSQSRAFAHGMWVAATGDRRRLQAMRREVLRSSNVAAAWQSVGQSLRRASAQEPPESPSR